MKLEVVFLICSLSQVMSAPYDDRPSSCRHKRPRYCRISGRRLDKILKYECRYVSATQPDICLAWTADLLKQRCETRPFGQRFRTCVEMLYNVSSVLTIKRQTNIDLLHLELQIIFHVPKLFLWRLQQVEGALLVGAE